MAKRTIVLMGKTGSGKSATGNSILGIDAFKSVPSVNSVTKECKAENAVINGKHVCVVDTPGFFDTEMPEDKLAEELAKSVYLSREGVHAFVLVFKYERFTQQEVEIITKMKKVFGEEVTKHIIVVFTHADEAGNDVENINSNQYIRKVLRQCGGRYQLFNNKNPNDTQQVSELLQKIDRMVSQDKERCYTSLAYEEANRSIWEKFWELFKLVFNKLASLLKVQSNTFYDFCMPSRIYIEFSISPRTDSRKGRLAFEFKRFLTATRCNM